MDTYSRIYLDYAATTPVDARVLEAMLPYFSERYGNPSSIHMFGQQAEAAIENAREQVAQVLNCQPNEIVFTSCGSESDNLALRGAAFAARSSHQANHLLISRLEHHAISHTAQQLAELHAFELEYLPSDDFGMLHAQDVGARLRPETAIVSVIHANNEIGTVSPIDEIGAVCKEHGVLFHTDAVQGAAYLPVDVQAMNVDLLSIGAHKFYGPKGVGALYVREGTSLLPSQTGGGQEHGLRAGTSNVPLIVGLAVALQLAHQEREQRIARLRPLRDEIIANVLEQIPAARLTGHPVNRLPNHASFIFEHVDGNALLRLLDIEGFACSSGSACKTGDPEPSEVLAALGVPGNWGLGSLRVTLGLGTTRDQVLQFTSALPTLVERIRALSR